MAHIKELLIRCHYRDCTVKASQEVWRDAYNFYGYFCKRHAKATVRSIEDQETRNHEQRELLASVTAENDVA